MNEIDEINDMIKESEGKIPKQKLGKKGKIIVTATLVVVGILIGSYAAITLTAQSAEKYWRPQKEFSMPNVDWSTMKNSYVVERKHYNDINGTVINQTIGSKKSNEYFKVEIVVKIIDYLYRPQDYDEILTKFYVSFKKLEGDYRVKELVFKYEPSDEDVRTLSFDYSYFTAKNLYFSKDVGTYPTPYGLVSNRMTYELWTLHQIRGINKDVRDIKEGGFSNVFEILLYDPTMSGKSHNITFHAILHYGRYVRGFFGSYWEDMHTLDAYVKIYIVPEGGE